MNIGDKISDAKKTWEEISVRALDLISEACPNYSNDLKTTFLREDVQNNTTRMGRIKKKLGEHDGKRRTMQILRDWFLHWNSDEGRAKRLAKAKEQGEDGDAGEQAWLKMRKQKQQRASATNINNGETFKAGGSGGGSGGGGGPGRTMRKEVNSTSGGDGDQPFWRSYRLSDESALIDPCGDEAPRLDLGLPPQQAHGYLFCSGDQAAKLLPTYAGPGLPVTFTIPPPPIIKTSSCRRRRRWNSCGWTRRGPWRLTSERRRYTSRTRSTAERGWTS